MERTLAEDLGAATVLVVDDDESNLELLSTMLGRQGCGRVVTLSDPFQFGRAYTELSPDVVLMDYRMPPTDGLKVLKDAWKDADPGSRIPVIMLTASANQAVRREALDLGVADFLAKDFDSVELVLRIRNVLRSHRLYRELNWQRNQLEETVKVRTRELEEARREILERLALAAEFRDDQTGEHTRRVGRYAAKIADSLGQPSVFVEAIGSAALLHDLGKIGVPDAILLKAGNLEPEEFKHIRVHPEIGAQILSGCTEPILAMAREIALTHHERWDGGGYPQGLAGDEIPLSGRIVAVADAFDAMTSNRPYKSAILAEAAIAEIVRSSGTHFDPRVVEAFLRLGPGNLR